MRMRILNLALSRSILMQNRISSSEQADQVKTQQFRRPVSLKSLLE